MDELAQNDDNSHVTDLKQLKEQFVSGLEGTTSWELLLISSTSVFGCMFYFAIIHFLTSELSSKNVVFNKSLVLEVLSFLIPMVLCQTTLLYPYGTSYLMGQIGLSLLALLLKLFQKNEIHQSVKRKSDPDSDTKIVASIQRTSVTVYRACLLFLTIVAILAVDFHAFPRRFGKTEIQGYGLMDLGAASFVIAAGIVSPRAKQYATSEQSIVWSKQVRRMLPLLMMGSLRLITHKGLDYPEHVSEYGVHWNFFFTLAFLMPIATVLSCCRSRPSWIEAVIVLLVYQYLLSMEGVQQWIEEAPRSCPSVMPGGVAFNTNTFRILCSLWYANREGILGCLSYAALYLVSEWWAYSFFWHVKLLSPISCTNAATILSHRTGKLWLSVVALFLLWQSLERLGLIASRRSTNAIFCVWVLFVNTLLLVAIHTVVAIYGLVNGHITSLLEAPPFLAVVNRNGLSVFIIANLLTGLVNLSINTLAVQNGIALLILMLYTSVVGIVAFLMEGLLKKLQTFQQEVVDRQSNAPQYDINQMKKED